MATQAAPNGDGRLRATVSATSNAGFTNAIQAITWGGLTNATVEVVGIGRVSQGQRTALPANTQSVTLLMSRVTAGQPFTVGLTVTDACGDFPTFLGAGANAL